jgi:hypothetical protein
VGVGRGLDDVGVGLGGALGAGALVWPVAGPVVPAAGPVGPAAGRALLLLLPPWLAEGLALDWDVAVVAPGLAVGVVDPDWATVAAVVAV